MRASHETTREHWLRSRSGVAFLLFAAVAGYFLWTEHRVHVMQALPWLLLAAFPFSRLVHVLVVPNQYLWRSPQVVRWYARPALLSGRKS